MKTSDHLLSEREGRGILQGADYQQNFRDDDDYIDSGRSAAKYIAQLGLASPVQGQKCNSGLPNAKRVSL